MSIWDRYPDYTDDELRALVKVTAETLMEMGEAGTPLPEDLLTISPRTAARQILPELQSENAGISQAEVQQVLEDEALTRQVCLDVLDEVRQYPELAEEIADRYENRQQKMAIPELILLSGALVILAMRIKEIKVDKKGKRITFYPSGEAVKGFVTGLVGKMGGL